MRWFMAKMDIIILVFVEYNLESAPEVKSILIEFGISQDLLLWSDSFCPLLYKAEDSLKKSQMYQVFFWISLNRSLISICHATLTISSGPEWSLGSISEMERGIMAKSNTPNTDWVEEILDLLRNQESKQSKEERLALSYFIWQVFKVLRTLDTYLQLSVITHQASHTLCHSVLITSTLFRQRGLCKEKGEWEKGVRRTFSGSQEESPGLREGESKQLKEGSLNWWDLWKIMKVQLAEALQVYVRSTPEILRHK